jgi:DNA repair protein RadD
MRISPETGKVDCRVLDFTSTSEEMPPLDLIEAPPPPKLTAKRESELGNLKECQQCQALIPLQARECPACGFQLPSSADSGPDIRDEASDAILLSTQSAPERLFRCTGWMTGIHTKIGKPTSLRVDYYDGMKTRASEWICFNHIGAPRVRATRWWLWMGGQNPPPESTEAAYERRDELTRPSAIKVRKDGKYDRVIGVSFGEVSEGAQTPLPN